MRLLEDVVRVLVPSFTLPCVHGGRALEDSAVAHPNASPWPAPKLPWREGVEGTGRPPPWVGTGDSWGTFMEGDTVSLAPDDSTWGRDGCGSACTPEATPSTKWLLSPRGGLVAVGYSAGTPLARPPELIIRPPAMGTW